MEKGKKYIIIGAAIAVLVCLLAWVLWPKEDKPISQEPGNNRPERDENAGGLKVEESPDEDDEGFDFNELWGDGVNEQDKNTDKNNGASNDKEDDKTPNNPTNNEQNNDNKDDNNDNDNKDDENKDDENKDDEDKDDIEVGEDPDKGHWDPPF